MPKYGVHNPEDKCQRNKCGVLYKDHHKLGQTSLFPGSKWANKNKPGHEFWQFAIYRVGSWTDK